jgi:hypothetical protein
MHPCRVSHFLKFSTPTAVFSSADDRRALTPEIREVHRLSYRLLTLALVVLFALPAQAQYTRDAAASRKIDEAINTHYLATEFDKAEAVLTGTIKACEDKCSPQTLAKAWMYVGIVRGSGRNDQTGAKEAFQSALALDPNIKLDAGLATPETQASFNNSGGGGAVETPATPAAAAPAAAGDAGGGGLTCTPAVTEIQTRRPVPVQCTSDEEVTHVELRYKAFGAETWKTLKMEHKGKSFRAQIPCDATTDAGILKLYVTGKNATGAPTVGWGTKNEPIEFSLAEETAAEPPSFDDADAPPRCAAKEICPPDFPGCDNGKSSGGSVDWGGSCGNSGDCKSGLLCMDGTCETAPSCSTTADCPAGTCENGKCTVSGGGGGGPTGPYKKWWFGLHVAQDVAFVGGDNVCMPESQQNDNFACYLSGDREKVYDPQFFGLKAVGRIPTGTVAATTRFLLSIDRALTANIMVGARIGYAINGGPPGGRQVTYNDKVPGQPYTIKSVDKPGQSFLPFHFELRASYWFGNNALARTGLRPYVHAGGGLAQVDAKVVVNVRDDDTDSSPTATTADGWKKLGQGFITVGGGGVWAFSQKVGAQLNLNAMYMLSATGIVLEPSLGMVFGF